MITGSEPILDVVISTIPRAPEDTAFTWRLDFIKAQLTPTGTQQWKVLVEVWQKPNERQLGSILQLQL